MPTRADCIANAAGLLSRDLLDAVRQAPEPDRLLIQAQAELALRKRQKALQMIKTHAADQAAIAHPHGYDAGVMALLTRDLWGAGTAINVEARAAGILSQAQATFVEGMAKLRSKAAGLVQDKDAARDVVRALYGERHGGGGDIDTIAKAWSNATDALRERFNRAGGGIAKREDWRLPQRHDQALVARYGSGPMEQRRAAWKDFVRPLLDRSKMVNDDGRPLTEIEFETALDHVYGSITTDGLANLKPGAQRGSKLGNRHQDHRFLIFKDADSWLKYQEQFGPPDIYTTMTDHLVSMSHEIALLETLGPNPNATYQFLRDRVQQQFAPGGDLQGKRLKNTRMQYMDSVWNVVSGKISTSANPNLADFANSVRHVLVASKLGGAFLSAMSDTTFQAMTRLFNGLPVMSMVRQIIGQMNPANEADRIFAIKLGLGADGWMNHSMVANRFTDVTGANMAAKLSDFTMRASLLSSWTNAGRWAFGLEFTSTLAERAGMSWDDLGKGGRQARALREALKRYNIGRDEWERFRQLEPMDYRGARYLRPLDAIEQLGDEDLAAKLLAMIHTESNFAVPVPDARVRAITTMGQSAGTWAGEGARALFQFKSFPLTVILTHAIRGATIGRWGSLLGYTGGAFIATSIIGALAIQSKEISRGKDPRPMDDPKFWVAAMAQGGGAGIAGDFLFSPVSRFGQGPFITALGPSVGLGDDLLKLTLDNVKQAVAGDDTNFADELVQFTSRNLPGSSIWYSRLVLEREIFDQLRLLADPKRARESWRRTLSRRRKEFGQDYFWRPGETAPDRGPDFSNALGD